MKILKSIIKWLLLISIVVAIVVSILWLLKSPTELAENSQSKARLEQANYMLEQMDLSIVDLERATPALGAFDGDAKRTLNGKVWFPKGESSGHPLIVYSHGFGGHHEESKHIAEYLVAQGYVVAAVNFPLSTMRSPAKIPQLVDVVNQPGDVSAVIDRLLSLNNDPQSVIYQRIDPTKIGAMGLSLGGLTTALVSFHPDLMDKRIKAAVMMAPPLEAFSEQFYASNPKVTSLLMSGSMDRVVPEPANATAVKERNSKGWFISLDKGTHMGFANAGNQLRLLQNPDNLGCVFMDMMLPKLDMPDRWDVVIPNTNGVLRAIEFSPPCPELPGDSMHGLKQQWLTRIAIGSFFDMTLQEGERANSAKIFFVNTLSSENAEVRLTAPR